VKEGVGKKKGRSGKEGVRRGGGICAIGFREDGRTCAETPINRLEDHFLCTPPPFPRVPKVGEAIFIVPPCTPGSQKWGDNVPHTPRLRRPCVLAYMAVSATESDVFSQRHRIHEDCLCELICHTSRFLVQETVHRRWTDAYPYVSETREILRNSY